MRADPKPAKRVVNNAAEPYDDGPLLAWHCPLCRRDVGLLTRHHVVPKSQGGDDLPENLVYVCGHGSLGCHGVLESRNRDGASGRTYEETALALVAYVRTLEPVVGYVERAKYDGWLEDAYL